MLKRFLFVFFALTLTLSLAVSRLETRLRIGGA